MERIFRTAKNANKSLTAECAEGAEKREQNRNCVYARAFSVPLCLGGGKPPLPQWAFSVTLCLRGEKHPDLRRMSLRISYAPYRLLFKHPFETAHGVREGTDSIFIRLEENGITGYGEITLPPYLKEKPQHVLDRLNGSVMAGLKGAMELELYLNAPQAWNGDQQGCRAGLHMALIDLLSKAQRVSVGQTIVSSMSKSFNSLMTIGITPVWQIAEQLQQLPISDFLKVKMNGQGSIPMLLEVLKNDQRRVFIDGNQGMQSVQEVMGVCKVVGDRLVGLEQPFAVKKEELQAELHRELQVCVYGDESIWGMADLERASGTFGGVNIKLMKCGGLDKAKNMTDRAAELGLKVMLGCMSESSLNCTAMAHLAGAADLLDLDGPLLIKNDPFEGMTMRNGKLVMPEGPGIGANLKAELEFNPICA
ncbi:MAG: mandelate racemase/muconate lactonizing enzyme family protein [Flavobacteriales bacterium]